MIKKITLIVMGSLLLSFSFVCHAGGDELIEMSTPEGVVSIVTKVVETTKEVETEITLPDTVYTTEEVNIRYSADINSDVLVTATTDTELIRTQINIIEGWDVVLIEDTEYYISNEFLTTDKPIEIAKDITEQIEDKQIYNRDLRYLAAIIFAEAGNQCVAGQEAVGIIVINRSASSNFADGVYNVIQQSGQFVPATNGSFNNALNLYDSGELPESCIEAAHYALQGNKTVVYNGITYNLSDYYFFSRYISGARLIIQEHMFK